MQMRAQIESLTKEVDKRKQHLQGQKKRLFDAMAATSAPPRR